MKTHQSTTQYGRAVPALLQEQHTRAPAADTHKNSQLFNVTFFSNISILPLEIHTELVIYNPIVIKGTEQIKYALIISI